MVVEAHDNHNTEKRMWVGVHEINLKRGEEREYFHVFPDLLNVEEKVLNPSECPLASFFFGLVELVPLN